MQCENLTALYQHFDDMAAAEADADALFATSYIRGFISLAACEFGDEQQALTKALARKISEQIHDARTELTPQDRAIVNQWWLQLQGLFVL
jgi:hypothetical protein